MKAVCQTVLRDCDDRQPRRTAAIRDKAGVQVHWTSSNQNAPNVDGWTYRSLRPNGRGAGGRRLSQRHFGTTNLTFMMRLNQESKWLPVRPYQLNNNFGPWNCDAMPLFCCRAGPKSWNPQFGARRANLSLHLIKNQQDIKKRCFKMHISLFLQPERGMLTHVNATCAVLSTY